jgi:hypothetical protein
MAGAPHHDRPCVLAARSSGVQVPPMYISSFNRQPRHEERKSMVKHTMRNIHLKSKFIDQLWQSSKYVEESTAQLAGGCELSRLHCRADVYSAHD